MKNKKAVQKLSSGVNVVHAPSAIPGLSKTNIYFIQSEGERLVIDTGSSFHLTHSFIQEHFGAISVDPLPTKVFLTHLHFDHAGLAKGITSQKSYNPNFLKRILQNEIGFIPTLEQLPLLIIGQKAHDMSPWVNTQAYNELELTQLVRAEGMKGVSLVRKATISFEANICDSPERHYHYVKDGDEIKVGNRIFQVIETPGHTYGDLCLFEQQTGILFSGDTLLKVISPGIAIPLQDKNPLDLYFKSLRKIEQLPISVVYPGHGDPFKDYQACIEKIRSKHIRRLGNLYEIIARHPGITGSKAIHSLKWRLPDGGWEDISINTFANMMNTGFAALKYLIQNNEVICENIKGVNHYYVND